MPHKGTKHDLLGFFSSVTHTLILTTCTEIMRKTGELFILRTNINSVGSVLDSPVRVYVVFGCYALTYVCALGYQEVFWVCILFSLFTAGLPNVAYRVILIYSPYTTPRGVISRYLNASSC